MLRLRGAAGGCSTQDFRRVQHLEFAATVAAFAVTVAVVIVTTAVTTRRSLPISVRGCHRARQLAHVLCFIKLLFFRAAGSRSARTRRAVAVTVTVTRVTAAALAFIVFLALGSESTSRTEQRSDSLVLR